MSQPGIELQLAARGMRVVDRRADVTPLLRRLPVAQAIKLVPSLLAVCAGAQGVAAQRALQAHRGEVESRAEGNRREQILLREQAMACAWRLLVDWPRARGEATRAHELGALRTRGDVALGRGLRDLLPDLDMARSPEQLVTWAGRRHCLAAEVASDALALAGDDPELSPLSGDTLWEQALETLSVPAGERCGDRGTGAICVGALAMARHPLIDDLRAQRDLSVPARLILAMLLDSLAAAQCLAAPARARTTVQRRVDSGAIGRADTARGPLFHQIRLGRNDEVEAWHVLAPTDWHVARDGLLAQLLRTRRGDADAALCVQAIDPCAPWYIRRDAPEPVDA